MHHYTIQVIKATQPTFKPLHIIVIIVFQLTLLIDKTLQKRVNPQNSFFF